MFEDNKLIDIYTEVFQSSSDCNEEIVKTHIQKLQELDSFLLPSMSFFILTNTVTNTYEFVSENFNTVLGLDKKRMLNEGVPYWFSHHHPVDLDIWLKMIKELMLFTMTEVEPEDRKKLSYTWNLRIKNKADEYVNVYKHQTPIVFDENEKPVIGISHNTVTSADIEIPMIASIKILNDNNEYETIYNKNYSQQHLTQGLSYREQDVLRLLALEKTSKQIAQKLSISHHTVDGHRRKIIHKLNLKNTADIISYCRNYQVF